MAGAKKPVVDDVASEAEGWVCGYAYILDGDWSCEAGETCQDGYSVDLAHDSTLELELWDVSRDSRTRLGVYGPGDALGGNNLLTNTSNERQCADQRTNLMPAPLPVSGGTFLVGISRDAATSKGTEGTYRLRIGSDAPFPRPTLTTDDALSIAPAAQCYWTYFISGSWACASATSCQDVFDTPVTDGATVVTSVFDVSSGSAVRMAAYGPGEPLTGVNLLTGSLDDYRCTGAGESVTTEVPTTSGTYRLAIGRDWGASAGSAGTYSATVHVRDGYGTGPVIQTVDDEASAHTSAVCP